MATVKFKKAGCWSVALEKQIDVKEGEVVGDLPDAFAQSVVENKGGEIIPDKRAKEKTKDTPPKADKKKAESK